MPDDLDDVRWLVSSQAAPWLAMAAEADSELKLTKQLRRELSAERARLVVEQAELRRRGATKFSRAGEMFFTRIGLEQASDEVLARYKAQRFPTAGLVLDLCCGIGGDLMALAQQGTAQGIERDPRLALFAAANSGAVASTQAVTADSLADLPPCTAWHIDPDRRSTGHRTTTLEYYEPPLSVLQALVERQPTGAMKLAPATELPADWPAPVEREWIGYARECKQQVAWCGELARQPGRQVATTLSKSAGPVSLIGLPDEPYDVAPNLGRYLFEPDPAVMSARLVGTLAQQTTWQAISPQHAWLTGDTPQSNVPACTFEILATLPYEPRKVQAWLRTHHIGRVEVKTRNVPQDPNPLQRAWNGEGDEAGVVLITGIRQRMMAVMARRISRGT